MRDASAFDRRLLRGNVVLVVGGSGGLGAGIARQFVRAGAHTIIASRSLDRCSEVATQLKGEFGSDDVASAMTLDIRDVEACERSVSEVAGRFGRLDSVVNSAGGGFQANIEDVSPRGFDAVLQLNLMGAFFLMQAAGRHMRKSGGGSIVHIVSPVTHRPIPGLVHVGAAKAGLISLSQGCAIEWAPFGIRVNCVAPGIFFTEGARAAIVGDELFEHLRSITPLGRYGTMEEMGDAVVFLASSASSYITGQCLYVDAGLFIGKGVAFREL
jgi:NAD(P)-dependent dehydrogenase (short-subunit alcohol dehydrogenase family)